MRRRIHGTGADHARADKKPAKQVVKLQWELLTPFSEFLRTLGTHSGAAATGEDEDEDEEELEAYEESLQRLRVRVGVATRAAHHDSLDLPRRNPMP